LMAARTFSSSRTVPMRERMSRCPRIVGVTIRNSACTGPAAPVEVDRMLEQEEGDLRLRHAQHDRIPYVRDREALRDSDRAELRASQQHLKDHASIRVRGERQSLHRGGHDRAPVVSAQPGHDASGADRSGQGSGDEARHGVPEEVARHGQSRAPSPIRRPPPDGSGTGRPPGWPAGRLAPPIERPCSPRRPCGSPLPAPRASSASALPGGGPSASTECR
jgi:hypothetical protein